MVGQVRSGSAAGDAHDRGYVDDTSSARRLHDRNDGAGTEIDTGGVDVHDPVPAVHVQRIGVGGAADSRVVHEYIYSGIALYRLIHQRLPGLGAGDVGVDIHGLATGVLYLAGDRLAVLVGDVGHDDIGALAGEQSCLLRSHTAGRSGDNRNFSFQTHFLTSRVAATCATLESNPELGRNIPYCC